MRCQICVGPSPLIARQWLVIVAGYARTKKGPIQKSLAKSGIIPTNSFQLI